MTKNEFYTEWLETFASEIPKKQIEKYVKSTGDFIWHIFSWKILKENQYLVGDDARAAFDKVNKRGAFCIEWFEDKHAKDLPDNLNTAKALDELVEVYVVGKNFEWTYIKTHENDWCGPYFMKLKQAISDK